MQITKSALTATADLGTATFHYDLTTDSSGGNYNVQMWLQNKDTGAWVFVSPGIETLLALLPGSDNAGDFSVPMPVGNYGGGKMSLFPEGTNYSAGSVDVGVPDLGLSVKTTQIRVTAPVYTLDGVSVQADGNCHVPFTLKVPAPDANWQFWVQAQGSGGFQQKQINPSDLASGTDPLDNYLMCKGELVFAAPTATGLYNLQGGCYTNDWKMLAGTWNYPGLDFGVGNWLVKADPAAYPDIAKALAPASPASPGFIGGDFGNDIATVKSAPFGTVAHFKIMRAAGLTVMRTNFDADSYLNSPIYRDKVDQLVQNQLAAGVLPSLSPQDMPTGTSQADAEAKLLALDVEIATRYKGVPLMLCLLNEPHGYDWAGWKALASKIAAAVRQANPGCKIVIDAEGYAKNLANVVASPPDPALYDYIGWHAYCAAGDLAANYAGANGLPVIVEEYNDSSAAFHVTLQTLPVKGVMAWAWNFPTRDRENLCLAISGAAETYTPVGVALLGYYATWRGGQAVHPDSLPASLPPAVPPVTPPAPPPPGAVTPAMQADLLHRVVMLEAEHLVDVNQIKGARYDIAALQARLTREHL